MNNLFRADQNDVAEIERLLERTAFFDQDNDRQREFNKERRTWCDFSRKEHFIDLQYGADTDRNNDGGKFDNIDEEKANDHMA